MKLRKDVVLQAIEECMKELYKFAQPSITWDEFIEQNKKWSKEKKGPKPYEFYYLDSAIFDTICKNYIDAYNLDYDLPGTIKILIDYLDKPIVDDYKEEYTDENGVLHPSRKGYKQLDSLSKLIGEENFEKVKDYLEKAGDFYLWDGDLRDFKMSIALGASPSSNKERVIKNWKEYRNKDIEINDLTDFEDEYFG